ncbi:MAG: hypothetical protein JSU05_15975 [Bacteroidetes bacterium]|nr:hypothetical protein [Bacteroidota bacterium]
MHIIEIIKHKRKVFSKSNTILTEAIACLFIFLFVYTGISKLTGHKAFERTLSTAPVIKIGAGIIAWFIPLAELITAGLLLFAVTRRKGMIAAIVLMTGFTMYIGYMLLFASTLPCSCGGVLTKMKWHTHFWFNLVFLLLGITGYYTTNKTQRFIAINRQSRKPV